MRQKAKPAACATRCSTFVFLFNENGSAQRMMRERTKGAALRLPAKTTAFFLRQQRGAASGVMLC